MTANSRAISRASLFALVCTLVTAAHAASAAAGDPPQLSPAQPADMVGTCDDVLTRLSNSILDATFTGNVPIAEGTLNVAGQPVAEHCRLTGFAGERVSPIDGKTYRISFEMRLPVHWNGRFFHQGNGGIDGSVVSATGTFGGGALTNALYQGFAVLSSDAGHSISQNNGPAFGFDPQARLDFGYQAVATLTPIAKAIIAQAYGKEPDRSYFGGCSNGGRHALVAAARYAQDYDGFLAGAPGIRAPLASLANIWGAQQYATVATSDPATPPGLETAFTAAERRLVAAAIVRRCDRLDGVADGMVHDTKACQSRFTLNRDVPTCLGARDGTCLTASQKAVISAIAKGARDSLGVPFYASFPFDPGIGGNGLPFWEFTAPLALNPGETGTIFAVPPSTLPLTNAAAYALGLDIDTALARLSATDATYTESALSFMNPPSSANLSNVRARGGKVIVYHGVADTNYSVDDSIAWYRAVDEKNAGRASSFARLYTIPGMGHCSGGPATDQADFITPLVAWVERGEAPLAIVAQARGAGNPGGVNIEVPASWAVDRTRPLCPWPLVARYKGSGSIETASSFVCAVKNP